MKAMAEEAEIEVMMYFLVLVDSVILDLEVDLEMVLDQGKNFFKLIHMLGLRVPWIVSRRNGSKIVL